MTTHGTNIPISHTNNQEGSISAIRRPLGINNSMASRTQTSMNMTVLTACILLLLQILEVATGRSSTTWSAAGGGDGRKQQQHHDRHKQVIDRVLSGHVVVPDAQQQRRELFTPEPRIVGGWDSVEDRYDYAQVSLQDPSDGHQCGGVLVAPDMVLTAAHCSGAFSWVVVGKHTLDDESDSYEMFGVTREIVHPGWDPVTTRFDVMLVILDGRSSLVRPVRINSDEQVPFNGQTLTIVGWGKTDDNGILPDTLQETTVTYTQNSDCVNIQDTDGTSLKSLLYSDMMCAGDDGRDSCYGDSGSPLILAGDSPENDLVVGLKICNQSEEPPSYLACSGPTESPSFPPTLNPTSQVTTATDGVDVPTDSPTSSQLNEFFGPNSSQTSSGNSFGANSFLGRTTRLPSNSAAVAVGILIVYFLI